MMERRKQKGESLDAVRKAARLLAALSDAGSAGIELGPLAEKCGVPKSTAHRILSSLLEEELVTRKAHTRRYVHRHADLPAHLAHAKVFSQSRHWRSIIAAIPLKDDDAIFLLGQSNDQAVCIDASFGRKIIPSLTNGSGGSIPLGRGPGATMLLSSCDDLTIRSVIKAATTVREREQVRFRIDNARKYGYATDPGEFIEGVGGIAVSIPTGRAGVRLALGIAFSLQDHDDTTRGTLKQYLLRLVSSPDSRIVF